MADVWFGRCHQPVVNRPFAWDKRAPLLPSDASNFQDIGNGALTVLKLRRDYLKQSALELRRIGTYLENVRSGLNAMLHG